jgi:tetratricopeptide (TPR) repeat protein
VAWKGRNRCAGGCARRFGLTKLFHDSAGARWYNKCVNQREATANLVRDLLEKAEGYILLEMYPEALELVTKALTYDQNNSALYYYQGECLRGMKKFQDALTPFSKALWLNPEDIGPYIGIGWCYKRLGELDRAIEILRDASKIKEDYPIVYYNLSCYYSVKNEKEKAIRWLKKAIELDSRFSKLCREEEDLDNLRDMPEFSRLLESK